jgi:hypothetical protein
MPFPSAEKVRAESPLGVLQRSLLLTWSVQTGRPRETAAFPRREMVRAESSPPRVVQRSLLLMWELAGYHVVRQ